MAGTAAVIPTSPTRPDPIYNESMVRWHDIVENSFIRAPRTQPSSPLATHPVTFSPPPSPDVIAPPTPQYVSTPRPSPPSSPEMKPTTPPKDERDYMYEDYMYEDLCKILGHTPFGMSVENIIEVMKENRWSPTEIWDVLDYLCDENDAVGYTEQSIRADDLREYYSDKIKRESERKRRHITNYDSDYSTGSSYGLYDSETDSD